MTQSLVQLPESAHFIIEGWVVEIKNHRVTDDGGLTGWIMGIVMSGYSNRDSLAEFEKHGISYEAAIEECCCELEDRTEVLADFIDIWYNSQSMWDNEYTFTWEQIHTFSKNSRGVKFAEEFIDRMRSCEDWGEFYDEMHCGNKFHKDMAKKTMMEIKTMVQSLVELPDTADYDIGAVR